MERKFKLKALLLIFLLTYLYSANAQDTTVATLQKQVQYAVTKAKAASVYLTDYDPKTKLAISERFSGVVVDTNGTILTVAHTTVPNQIYHVVFPDGKEYTATGLGCVPSFGIGILKINEKGNWPYASMGWSSSLKTNEPCLRIAYPASFDTGRMVVRFGYVAELTSKSNADRIRTTCLMEPGDSGGPVFDLLGRVIGLSNNIDFALENNYEVPIDLYRRYWNALQDPVRYDLKPVGESISSDSIAERKHAFNDITVFASSFLKAERQFEGSVVKVTSAINRNKSTVAGTVVNDKGKSFIITKSSMVGSDPLVNTSTGKNLKAKIIRRDTTSDLILLELETVLQSSITLKSVPEDTLTLKDLGRFLFSPLPDAAGKWSVIGTARFNLGAKYRAGYSGAGTVMKDGKLIVNLVMDNSAAKAAKVTVGDQVLAINGTSVNDPYSYINEIRKYYPGDIIRLSRIKADIKDTVEIKLAAYPEIFSGHIAETFKGGKSKIRDGFNHVFVHDAKITPAECGGPVFDIRGSLMGINMARYSRTSCIVVTVPELKMFLENSIRHYTAEM